MIETVAALVAALVHVNAWMMTFPAGRSWALGVKSTITNAQLEANRPACCLWVKNEAGAVFRSSTGQVFLINLPH